MEATEEEFLVILSSSFVGINSLLIREGVRFLSLLYLLYGRQFFLLQFSL
jgi:hypothetical protein